MKRTKGQSQSNALFKWDNESQQITKYEEVMEMSGCRFKLCSLYIYRVKACTDTYNPIKKIPVHKQDHQRWRYIPVKTVITVKFSLNGEIQLMLWNSVEIEKFSHNCEIQLKLRNSFETAKFSWKCEIQSCLWNPVITVKFSHSCEIQSQLWDLVILEKSSHSCGIQS